MMDAERVARELLRALRGKRSQWGFSRHLGYASNVSYMWESGRREPRAAELFRAASRTGRKVLPSVVAFLGEQPEWLRSGTLAEPEGLAAFMRHLGRGSSVTELAARIGRPRSTLSRWLSGQTECSLADLLRFVGATTRRLTDFVAVFADPAQIPSLAARWEEERLRRELATRLPVSQAVLRALELAEYRALSAHRPGFIAARLGISARDEAEALEALEKAAVIRWDGTRYDVEPVTLDVGRAGKAAHRSARAYWLEQARERLEAGSDGLFSYNVVSVSSADFERLQRMHVRYFEEVRAVVAASEPLERVAVLGLQLFELAPPPAHNEPCHEVERPVGRDGSAGRRDLTH